MLLAHAIALAFLGDPPVDKKATEAATERGDPKIVYCSADHIDTDYLNDVLHNIRWATAEEQRANQKARERNCAEARRLESSSSTKRERPALPSWEAKPGSAWKRLRSAPAPAPAPAVLSSAPF